MSYADVIAHIIATVIMMFGFLGFSRFQRGVLIMPINVLCSARAVVNVWAKHRRSCGMLFLIQSTAFFIPLNNVSRRMMLLGLIANYSASRTNLYTLKRGKIVGFLNTHKTL